MLKKELDRVLWIGSYPPIHDRKLRPAKWLSNYLSTYIERDVRQIAQVHNLTTFTRFMRLCAGHVGQLFNSSKLGTECGVDHKTIRHWLSVLQVSYVVQLLPPFYRNFKKRVIKTPKLYFYDTGLVCHLLGIQTPDQLSHHPLRGALFENWVFTELTKKQLNQGERFSLYFWRTHGGQEIDFICQKGDRVLAFEAKAGMTVRPSMLHSMENALKQWDTIQKQGWVIFGGEEPSQIHRNIILPWKQIGSIDL